MHDEGKVQVIKIHGANLSNQTSPECKTRNQHWKPGARQSSLPCSRSLCPTFFPAATCTPGKGTLHFHIFTLSRSHFHQQQLANLEKAPQIIFGSCCLSADTLFGDQQSNLSLLAFFQNIEIYPGGNNFTLTLRVLIEIC